eukprot:s3110_g10.t1
MTVVSSDPMDLDAQEKLFWSQAGPVKREPETTQTRLKTTEAAKRQRLGPQDKGKSKGKGSKGKGKGFSRPGGGGLTSGHSRSPSVCSFPGVKECSGKVAMQFWRAKDLSDCGSCTEKGRIGM